MHRSRATRTVVVRAWSMEGIGVEDGEYGWEILSVVEWPEVLEHAVRGWPDGAYESKVVKCTWPASVDEERLRMTIQRLGISAFRNRSLGPDAFLDGLRIFPEPEP